ncbi:MAG: sensor histidine kinase [bacterium]
MKASTETQEISKHSRFQNLSLRWKILLIILPLIVLTFLGFTLIHVFSNRNQLINNTENFLNTLVQQLRFNIARGYEVHNARSLFQLVQEYLDYDSRIINVRVITRAGEITADRDEDKIFNMNTDPEVGAILAGGADVLRRFKVQEKVYYKAVVPIYSWNSTRIIGALLLLYDASEMFQALRKAQTLGLLGSLLFILLTAIAITLFLDRRITFPLERLTESVSSVNVLKPVVPELDIQSKDEIGTLSRTFRHLLLNLQKANAELTQRTKEIEQAYKELKETQVQLIQSEKMAALGQLTAGIAHEVNNPMNFVTGNLNLLEDHLKDVKRLLKAYEQIKFDEKERKQILALKSQIDFENIIKDLDVIITDCKTGANRTIEIVKELRNFSRLDRGAIQFIDINSCIDTILKLLQPNYKDRIQIKKDYGDLPKYECYSGLLDQVFMNLIMNSIQAIEGQGNIIIQTSKNESKIRINISDNGKGIPREISAKIFDPFFTTKEIGKGTGLGLSISYRIVQQHGGTITFESEPGKGTCMHIQLPIKGVTDHVS